MNSRDNLCGLFGGTFDPIHFGHLKPIRQVCEMVPLTQVTFIPASIPPHRPQPVATAAQRLEMVHLALAEESSFDVDDVELRRARPSYTFDTVHLLQQANPERKYALIMGLDALLGLETWYRWQALQQRIHIIGIARPGWKLPHPLPAWWHLAQIKSTEDLQQYDTGKIAFIEVTPVAISATMFREGVSAGKDVGHFVPPNVWDYICENQLYGKKNQSS